MEDVPPSYESAVNRDAWDIIAPWIPSGDLCSASLVCRKWHTIFAPSLWGAPASHFGTQNDAVYVALTRFKRTLRRARLDVRQLTHTLHLPPALSEIYGGPNPFWLRDVLEYLPSLQSLIVSQLPFFDHHSLVALRYASNAQRASLEHDDERPQYGLKLLLAEREPNTTSAGLREALFHFPHLVYLDLSYTSPARDVSVLSALGSLWNLQILKLKGIGLRDSEAEVLANAIGIRVRLLDLRENQLTDTAVKSLMQACFLPPERLPKGGHANRLQNEDWPVGIPAGPDFLSLESLRSEGLDRALVKQLTHPLTGRLAFEDIPHKGLTHLYIADNNLSVEGLSGLLKSTRLHVLDGGSVDIVETASRTRTSSSPTGCQHEMHVAAAEKLIPVLAAYATHNLTYLRISHIVVTGKLQAKDAPSVSPSPSPVPGSSATELEAERTAVVEAPAPAHYAVEASSEIDAVFELSAEPSAPKSELPGDCIHFAVSPPVNRGPLPNGSVQGHDTATPKRGDGAFAPEVATNGVETRDNVEDGELIRSTSGPDPSFHSPAKLTPLANDRAETMNLLEGDLGPVTGITTRNGATPPATSTSRLSLIESLLRKRLSSSLFPPKDSGTVQTHEAASPQAHTHLHPFHLPNLRTLILTGVPEQVPTSSSTIAALLRFISACADEEHLARLQAQTDYSLPPGHSRRAVEIQYARSLFALRTIVLEIGIPKPLATPAGKAWDHSRAKLNMLRSSTGDRDSEALWSAAENDFSFFGEEGEEENECGIYQNEPEKYFPTARTDEKIVLRPEDHQSHSDRTYSVPAPIEPPRRSPTGLQPSILKSPTLLQSPRNLPLGKNRRSSNSPTLNRRTGSMSSAPRNVSPLPNEMQGTVSSSLLPRALRPPEAVEPMVDVVAELAKFRREKKREYDDALLKWRVRNNPNNPYSNYRNLDSTSAADAKEMPFVEGHWKGEIKVVRNAAPKGRSGVVDMYGNYFEKGYLYP